MGSPCLRELAQGTLSLGARQPRDRPAPQGVSVVLADRNCTVHGEDPHVRLQVATSPLNLVLDVVVGSSYNLTLIWNKRMTVSISVTRGSQVLAPPRGPGPPTGRGSTRPDASTPPGCPVRPVRQLQREHERRLRDAQQLCGIQ